MEFRTDQGRAAVRRAGGRRRATSWSALDFDGTLSPIVDDPARPHIHPDAPTCWSRWRTRCAPSPSITGRPARQVVELGDLDEVADELGERARAGRARPVRQRALGLRQPRGHLPASRRTGLAPSTASCPACSPRRSRRRPRRGEGAGDRRAHPPAARPRRPPSSGCASRSARPPSYTTCRSSRAGCVRGPRARHAQGRRGPHALVEEHERRRRLFAGDDLGDIEAFDAVAELREDGLATLLVCSASDEQEAARRPRRRGRRRPRRRARPAPPADRRAARSAPDARAAGTARSHRSGRARPASPASRTAVCTS